MKKKILAMILTICMVMTMVPMTAAAAEGEEASGVPTYDPETKTVTVYPENSIEISEAGIKDGFGADSKLIVDANSTTMSEVTIRHSIPAGSGNYSATVSVIGGEVGAIYGSNAESKQSFQSLQIEVEGTAKAGTIGLETGDSLTNWEESSFNVGTLVNAGKIRIGKMLL